MGRPNCGGSAVHSAFLETQHPGKLPAGTDTTLALFQIYLWAKVRRKFPVIDRAK
jgi:hypothetical protein